MISSYRGARCGAGAEIGAASDFRSGLIAACGLLAKDAHENGF